MADLNWTYEEFCSAIPALTYSSSAPTTATELNPTIQQLLTISGSCISGIGGKSVLLRISKDVMAKVSLKSGSRYLSHEQTIFKLLEQSPSPYIVQTFLHRPDITFMQSLSGGTLSDRMDMVNVSHPILQWMQQAADAVACLESYGYVHGDINPRNIMFDDKGQLKLIDLDNALKVGEDVDVGYEPYVRFNNTRPGGNYGIAGAITEQFALGSIFWFMYKGKELYSELEGSKRVDYLMHGIFPDVDPHDPIDKLIKDCWLGRFPTILELSKHIRAVAAFDGVYQDRKKCCEH